MIMAMTLLFLNYIICDNRSKLELVKLWRDGTVACEIPLRFIIRALNSLSDIVFNESGN